MRGIDARHKTHLHRIEHAVEDGDVAAGIGYDRIGDLVAATVVERLNVPDPHAMAGGVVAAQSGHLDAPPVELALQVGDGSKLGRAHRGEVTRVREEHRPRPPDVLVPR